MLRASRHAHAHAVQLRDRLRAVCGRGRSRAAPCARRPTAALASQQRRTWRRALPRATPATLGGPADARDAPSLLNTDVTVPNASRPTTDAHLPVSIAALCPAVADAAAAGGERGRSRVCGLTRRWGRCCSDWALQRQAACAGWRQNDWDSYWLVRPSAGPLQQRSHVRRRCVAGQPQQHAKPSAVVGLKKSWMPLDPRSVRPYTDRCRRELAWWMTGAGELEGWRH